MKDRLNAVYDKYVDHMFTEFGPFQGGPPTLSFDEFWDMMLKNKHFIGHELEKEYVL